MMGVYVQVAESVDRIGEKGEFVTSWRLQKFKERVGLRSDWGC